MIAYAAGWQWNDIGRQRDCQACHLLTAKLGKVLHAAAGRSDQASSSRRIVLSQQDGMRSVLAQSATQPVPLAEALRIYSDEDADPPPPQLLKKYIAYARTHVHPQLSGGARQVSLQSENTTSCCQAPKLCNLALTCKIAFCMQCKVLLQLDPEAWTTHVSACLQQVQALQQSGPSCLPPIGFAICVAQILREFWLDMRAKSAGTGNAVTLRQLESLIRLAEARARCDLRSEITEVRHSPLPDQSPSMPSVYARDDVQLMHQPDTSMRLPDYRIRDGPCYL